MTATTTAGAFVPVLVPDLSTFVDSGGWRECGVTHWHLTVSECGTSDPHRYDRERWAAMGRVGTLDDPREVLRWICERRIAALERAADPATAARQAGWSTPEGWNQRAEVTWEVLTKSGSTPAGGGIAINGGRSVEIYAQPIRMGCH